MNNLKRDGRYELSKKISISFDDFKVSHSADEDINDALMRCIEESGLTMAQFARKSGITLSDEELCAEANKWELSHGGISGRTAQQFINYVLGTMSVNA